MSFVLEQTNDTWSIQKKQIVDEALRNYLPNVEHSPQHLHQAMHYVVFNGGKRIRPLLVLAIGSALQIPEPQLLPIACAIEFIHVYSLTHDDLPAMDNDDWRRNKPSCHKAFDEATAILVGDALQTLAFQLLAEESACWGEDRALQMIRALAKAAGSQGMVGGQALDLTCSAIDEQQLERIHRNKTGALFNACAEMVCLSQTNLRPADIAHLTRFTQCFGLAFQLYDDLLDQTHDTNSPSYTRILGVPATKRKLQQLLQEALSQLTELGDSALHLRNLVNYFAI